MASKPKSVTAKPEVDEYCPLAGDSDLVKAVREFSGTGNSPRSFRAVQTNQDGSALAVEINTPR